MHDHTGLLVLVCLPLSLHPLHLLASFHGNNSGSERERERERKESVRQREIPKNVICSLTPAKLVLLGGSVCCETQ